TGLTWRRPSARGAAPRVEFLRLGPGGEAPEPFRVAARLALAVPRRQHGVPPTPSHGLQDAARELLLGERGDDGPVALVLERRAAILRDAIAARALGVTVEIEQVVGHPGVLGAQALEETGVHLALPAAEEDGQVERRIDLVQNVAGDGRERERP